MKKNLGYIFIIAIAFLVAVYFVIKPNHNTIYLIPCLFLLIFVMLFNIHRNNTKS